MSGQSIIIPYHRDREMIKFAVNCIVKTVSSDVEIVIVGNNYLSEELAVDFPYSNVKYYTIEENLFYPRAINFGVEHSSGEIITFVDPDVFVKYGWYEPLIEAISHSDIGAVGCKLINPSTGRIIDFGISHTRVNAVHPLMGERPSFHLASESRRVRSICSAVLTTRRSLFEELNGMDINLPYTYTDIDYCFRLDGIGKSTMACANSIAYHKGSSDPENSKSYSFKYLNADSKAMFYSKWGEQIPVDLGKWFRISFSYFRDMNNDFARRVFLLDLSTVYDRSYYYELLREQGIEFLESHVVPVKTRDIDHLTLHKMVDFDIIETAVPILYFVDSFLELFDNSLWFDHRDITRDYVVDRNGCVHMLSDISNRAC